MFLPLLTDLELRVEQLFIRFLGLHEVVLLRLHLVPQLLLILSAEQVLPLGLFTMHAFQDGLVLAHFRDVVPLGVVTHGFVLEGLGVLVVLLFLELLFGVVLHFKVGLHIFGIVKLDVLDVVVGPVLHLVLDVLEVLLPGFDAFVQLCQTRRQTHRSQAKVLQEVARHAAPDR